MLKAVASWMVLFVIFTIINGIYENGGGLAATKLDGALSNNATTINVESTVGFLTADAIVIEEEKVTYTGKTATSFTGCTRGYQATDAMTHEDGRFAYTLSTNILNQSLGFNIMSTGATVGVVSVIGLTWNFMWEALPNLVIWDFAFLQGQMVILRVILMAVSIGLIVTLGIQLITSAVNILTP